MAKIWGCLAILFTAVFNHPALAIDAVAFAPHRHKMPDTLLQDVEGEKSVRLIVRYADPAIDQEIELLERTVRPDRQSKANLLALKTQRFGDMKKRANARMDRFRLRVERDYSHLPMNVVTVDGNDGLYSLVSDPNVVEVYRDRVLQHFLTQSAPLIGATQVVNQTGYQGSNTMVVVLDTGVNYTLASFGTCSSPGQPASCRVAVAQDLAPNDNALDDNGHGTNVSGIVAGIAPGTKLAVLDVFQGANAYDSVVIQGINWAIANQLSYNIASINMSLGDTSHNTSQCSGQSTNPFLTPIASAYSAGILTVIASGNSAVSNGSFVNGVASPACTPLAVSVGAVYDSDVGGLNWGICTDYTTHADQITCFSNSASYLSVLAPGALITAAGYTMGGTSQATPHVAAALAILRGARPSETLAASLTRLTSTGTPITDTRNSTTTPRIDVLAAVGSVNDNLSANTALTAGVTNQTVTSYTAIASNQFSSKEAGEPNHAGNAGGKSVWFEWIAPAAGIVTVDTHGSSFDTLLAVYTGSTIAALTEVASNDNDGSANGNSSLTFHATAGVTYKIAVDGYNGAFGQIHLNLQFNNNVSVGNTPSVQVPMMPPWSQNLLILAFIAIWIAALNNRSRQNPQTSPRSMPLIKPQRYCRPSLGLTLFFPSMARTSRCKQPHQNHWQTP